MGNSKLGDGRSGAAGNTNGGPPLLSSQIGASRPQPSGSTRAPQSVSAGGPVLKLDPPSLRGGMVADPNRRPFKLGMSERPMPEDPDAMRPVGTVSDDSGDSADDPSAEGS